MSRSIITLSGAQIVVRKLSATLADGHALYELEVDRATRVQLSESDLGVLARDLVGVSNDDTEPPGGAS